MATDISTRNGESQAGIFPSEIPIMINGLLQCDMAKRTKLEPREIFLGVWLKEWNIGPTEAARIAGCTQSYISNISAGARSNVNALYLLRLSEHIGVNINDFFRPLPSKSQLDPLKNLSPKAQAAVLGRHNQKN